MSHAPPARGLLGEGEQFFSGLHSHFHHRMRRMMMMEGDEGIVLPPRLDAMPDPRQGLGAHIQLARR